MTEPLSPEEISKTFKEVFADKKGLIVLDKIKLFCLGEINQDPACIESTNQTFYNLGANAVYRYIQYEINMKLNQENKDCVIENKEKTGE